MKQGRCWENNDSEMIGLEDQERSSRRSLEEWLFGEDEVDDPTGTPRQYAVWGKIIFKLRLLFQEIIK